MAPAQHSDQVPLPAKAHAGLTDPAWIGAIPPQNPQLFTKLDEVPPSHISSLSGLLQATTNLSPRFFIQ